MQALEILAFGPASATRIAEALAVHPRTARRLLNRMVYDQWLLRVDGPRPTYVPTRRILALAAQLADRDPLIALALAPARALHADTGLIVHVAIPCYRSTLRLLRVGPDGHWLARDLAPAHATAAGKLLLAHRTAWRDAVLDAPLPAVTDHTRTDARDLRAELDRATRRGYAVERDEFRAQTRAIAAPVMAPDGDVIAALALSSLHDGGDPGSQRDALLAAAAQISDQTR